MHIAPHRPGSLDAAVRALREAERNMGASDAVRARLHLQVRANAAGRLRTERLTLAATAVLLIGITASLWQLSITRQAGTVLTRADPQEEVVTAFFPLPYGNVPVTNGHLVRLEVPRTALAAFGIEAVDVVAAHDTEQLLADVLVGDDGLARAVRFVRPTRRQEREP
jgi:hypothetical protein